MCKEFAIEGTASKLFPEEVVTDVSLFDLCPCLSKRNNSNTVGALCLSLFQHTRCSPAKLHLICGERGRKTECSHL